jgi:hypothetical protein
VNEREREDLGWELARIMGDYSREFWSASWLAGLGGKLPSMFISALLSGDDYRPPSPNGSTYGEIKFEHAKRACEIAFELGHWFAWWEGHDIPSAEEIPLRPDAADVPDDGIWLDNGAMALCPYLPPISAVDQLAVVHALRGDRG